MGPISPFSAFQVFVDLPELRWQGESVEPHPYRKLCSASALLVQPLAPGSLGCPGLSGPQDGYVASSMANTNAVEQVPSWLRPFHPLGHANSSTGPLALILQWSWFRTRALLAHGNASSEMTLQPVGFGDLYRQGARGTCPKPHRSSSPKDLRTASAPLGFGGRSPEAWSTWQRGSSPRSSFLGRPRRDRTQGPSVVYRVRSRPGSPALACQASPSVISQGLVDVHQGPNWRGPSIVEGGLITPSNAI
ncbi:hypothetical protein FALBO_2324 [Fusarium albosuccineum]|uniref:Uncharacterized protein n=1 Tax=Fusarium albosuccineum TaxID=1237068 RepID=A0A8H4LM93_9HYPO|nr:hypothetical protein FALBO_2324 [Fusarium albosuccineum]